SYPWGIGVHADSQMTWRLGGAFRTFQSVVGVDGCSSGGSVVFVVLGDGKVLHRSPVLRGTDAAPHEISVSVESIDLLTLKVEDAGDFDLGDVANWAAAQLLR
ncbi:MAG TPA: NPCBM/NEW2 domain-containing protein, partial [Planctomycetota bacterium]|nr:NPCBM/NEW2 domain-containing protein [Planctomycetota bacterium]